MKQSRVDHWKRVLKERVKKMLARVAKQFLFIIGTRIVEGIAEWAMSKSMKVQKQFHFEEENYDFREVI
jgi:hypothetical protein